MKFEKTLNILPPCFFYLFAIFLTVLAVFQGALDLEFLNWDDPFYVYENPMIQSLDWVHLKKMATEFHSANWHPLTWFSHALDYRFYELSPWGHHLTNIILHGLNTGLVFLLFVTMMRKVWQDRLPTEFLWISASVTALLFGLHPLRVESVAWVSERKDLLCGFFFLSTLLVYLFYATAETPGTRRRGYLLAMLCFILALLSKPMAVTLPLVLFLLDVYPLNRFWGQEKPSFLVLEKLPFFAFSLISAILTFLAQNAGGAVKSFEEYALDERILNAIRTLMFYMEQTLWPGRLVPFYPFPKNLTLTSVSVAVSALLVFAVTYFCVRMWGKKQKFWGVAWLYYLITIFPVIGIFQVGLQGAADRYTYLPTLSIYFLIGGGILWEWEKSPLRKFKSPSKIGSLILVLAVMTCLSLLTIQQVQVWKNGESFWKYLIGQFPNQISFAHVGLGDFYKQKGLLENAETEFKKALRINPDDSQANYNLGWIYNKKNAIKKAEEVFNAAIRSNPKNYQAHNSLGLIYAKRGQFEIAEKAFQNALNIDSRYIPSLNNLGIIYIETGRLKDAERMLKYALTIKPEYLEAYDNLGLVYHDMGLSEKAIENFKTALKLDPFFAPAYNNLGLSYFKAGQLGNAENAYKKALEIDPEFQAAQFNLAQLYYRRGKWKKAEEVFNVLLNLNPKYHLARYKLGVLYYEINRLEDAERQLIRVIKEDPARAQSHFYLAVVYVEKGRYEEAESEFKTALEIDSGKAEFHNQLGILYGKTGRLAKAETEFRAALAINPKHASARTNLEKAMARDNP